MVFAEAIIPQRNFASGRAFEPIPVSAAASWNASNANLSVWVMAKIFDFRKIDLNLIHIFEAIYTAQSVTRAAQQLNMTQPTVSNALARLREQLDDPLFQRSEKGVAPTPFAESLIDPVRKALSILRDGITVDQDFQITNAVRTFRLAVNDFAVATLLPSILVEIAARSKGVKLNVLGSTVTTPLASLLAGEADVAVDSFAREEPGVDFVPIHMPNTVVVARRGHPVIQGSITSDQYCEAKHIVLSQSAPTRAHVEAALLTRGIRRDVVCEIANSVQIPALVAETDLVAILPGPFAHRAAQHYDLQVLPVPFEFPGRRLQIATLTDKASDPGIVWIRQQLRRSALTMTSTESWLSQQ